MQPALCPVKWEGGGGLCKLTWRDPGENQTQDPCGRVSQASRSYSPLSLLTQFWQNNQDFKIAMCDIFANGNCWNISSLMTESVSVWPAIIVIAVGIICNDMLSFVFKDNATNTPPKCLFSIAQLSHIVRALNIFDRVQYVCECAYMCVYLYTMCIQVQLCSRTVLCLNGILQVLLG